MWRKANAPGDEVPFTLLYSGIVVNLSDRYWQSGWPDDFSDFLAPDIASPQSFDAYAAGRDEAMQAIEVQPSLSHWALRLLCRADFSNRNVMPKIDVAAIPVRKGSSYPRPFDEIARARMRKALGDAGGLTQFGVNLLTLPPGAASSQRHWHSKEDEFVYVLSGEVVLVTDRGEEILRAGDCAGFPHGSKDGHQIVNKSPDPAMCLEVGTRADDDVCIYSDIDMMADNRSGYTHKDGTPYA